MIFKIKFHVEFVIRINVDLVSNPQRIVPLVMKGFIYNCLRINVYSVIILNVLLVKTHLNNVSFLVKIIVNYAILPLIVSIVKKDIIYPVLINVKVMIY